MKIILKLLLLFVPIAILAEALHWSPVLIFVLSALAIVPLAGLLGDATEALAIKTGPRIGGLLNATLGNAAELIITIIAIRAGEMALVSASIIGSILGNVLLVLGAAILFGGLKNGIQKFDRSHAGLNATLLFLAAIAIAVPSLFNAAIEPDAWRVEGLSIATSVVMLTIYVLAIGYILFSKKPDVETAGPASPPPEHNGPHWNLPMALVVLIVAVAAIALLSEFLVGAVEPVTETLGFSTFFVGIILIPIIGNVAEHVVAVEVATKNHMELSLNIALGSSLQIALFVAPLLVLISPLLGNPFVLEFNTFELIALVSASVIGALVAIDGQSNWLEGSMLLAVYLILGIAFFFLPISI
ncbi:MAG: calcium/proton exchanger [Clostridia bacterium]|nr:MAG: calcium/proton exchanger [Clostridia bacterium]